MKQPPIPARPQMISRRFREAADSVPICGFRESVGNSGACEFRAIAQLRRSAIFVEAGCPMKPTSPVGATCSRRCRSYGAWCSWPDVLLQRYRPDGASAPRASVLECGGMTPLSLRRCQVEAPVDSGRFGAVHRAGKAETCLRSPKWWNPGVVAFDSAPPLFTRDDLAEFRAETDPTDAPPLQ